MTTSVHHYRNASIFHAFELIPAAMVVSFPFAPAALGDRFVLQVGQYPTILPARKKDISIPAVAHLLQLVWTVTSFLIPDLQLVNMLQLTHTSSVYSPRLVVVISGSPTSPPVLWSNKGMIEDWSRGNGGKSH